MLYVSGKPVDLNSLPSQYTPDSIEAKTLKILASSKNSYIYDSFHELKSELDIRKGIVDAALKLEKSKFSFKVFSKSKCNRYYWTRTHEGGFLLKPGVEPSSAIKDIYINSSKYGTECATAIVIVFYGALVNLFPEELFNKLFAEIYLMDWEYLDPDLGIRTYANLLDYLPGDCRYFKNPDVNPKYPEWKGENVIDLGNGTYYGHGIGIGTAEQIIKELNKYRKKDAQRSAYLMDTATRPDFKYLAKQLQSF